MSLQENVQEVKITVNDLIYGQVKDLNRRMDRLENRIDTLESRFDKIHCEKVTQKPIETYQKTFSPSLSLTLTSISTEIIAAAVIYSLLR